MKPHPKLRKMVKWGGLVLTVLLAGAWVASAWWARMWVGGPGRGLTIGHGVVAYFEPNRVIPRTAFPFLMPSDGPRLHWAPSCGPAGSAYWQCTVPLWVPALASLLATAAAWRLDVLARRRPTAVHCAGCGYDRAGLPTASPCPECAAVPVTPTAAPM